MINIFIKPSQASDDPKQLVVVFGCGNVVFLQAGID